VKKYYIYAFLDKSKPGEYRYGNLKFDFEPFYIGKGTGDRITTSLLDRESPFKVNKIKKIKRLGGEIVKLKLFENLENLEALEREIEVINKIGRRDLKNGPLVNQTDGGDGRLNSPHSQETKDILREINTKNAQVRRILGTDKHTPEMVNHLRKINQGENNPMFGKHHTEQVKEEQSLRVSGTNHPMFGKKHDEKTLKKIKENRNKNVNQEKVNQLSRELNSKSVLQFNLYGELIQEFSSIKEASEKTGCSESIIGKCCRGVIKKPRKYIFKFKDSSSLILNNSYSLKIDDIFEINNLEYRLRKRNKNSVIAESENQLFTFRQKDYPFLFEKIKLEL
jgi:group I intron endonuclease